jgi:acetyl-CoA carboxylase carboxyl transferase subunit alpha
VVIGEGGSGGALGIGVGDRVAILQHAYYSVISPEGCAGILWKSHTFKEQAAEALKMTSQHLLDLEIVDDVVREPLGGAHRDHHAMAANLKIFLRSQLRALTAMPVDQLVEARYQRFRRMGVFLEPAEPAEEEESADEQTAPAHHLDKAAAEKRETADQAVDSPPG